VTYRSKDPIYYLTVTLTYTRSKREVTTEAWVITRYLDPIDIMLYDKTTMQRLRREYYGNRKVKEKPVNITEVLDVTVLGRENQPTDDKKGPDSSGHSQGSRPATSQE
tara:strand:+ start:1737 stop:2060 length:324 start_codon:yes stop_codon:yes gene_type:complete